MCAGEVSSAPKMYNILFNFILVLNPAQIPSIVLLKTFSPDVKVCSDLQFLVLVMHGSKRSHDLTQPTSIQIVILKPADLTV